MRLDRATTKIAATRIWQLEAGIGVQQWPEEHDHAAGAPSGLEVHLAKVEVGGSNQFQIISVGRPGCPDTDARQHLQDPVDLLNLGYASDHRTAAVQQAGTEQGDRRILRRANGDVSDQPGASLDSQVLRSSAPDRDERRVERLGDPGYHFEAEVLVTSLDPMNRALAGPQHICQLGLGKTSMLAGVPDQAPDPVQVRIRHVTGRYVICEIFGASVGVSADFSFNYAAEVR